MSLCTIAEADGSNPISFDANPATYQVVPGERRMSVHPIVGDRLWQDFGSPGVDRQIKLHTDWMESSTLDDVLEAYQTTGAIWEWTDSAGTAYLVVFRSLEAVPIRGYAAYQVSIVFDVVEQVAP